MQRSCLLVPDSRPQRNATACVRCSKGLVDAQVPEMAGYRALAGSSVAHGTSDRRVAGSGVAYMQRSCLLVPNSGRPRNGAACLCRILSRSATQLPGYRVVKRAAQRNCQRVPDSRPQRNSTACVSPLGRFVRGVSPQTMSDGVSGCGLAPCPGHDRHRHHRAANECGGSSCPPSGCRYSGDARTRAAAR